MKMTFGKFKGTEIKEISKSYLTWLLTLDNLDKDLKAEIEVILNGNVESDKEEGKTVIKNPATTILNFGKYKGLRIAEVYSFDYSYLNFLISNNNFLSDTIKAAIDEINKAENAKAENEAKYVQEFLANEAIQFKVENDYIVFNVPFLLKAEFKSFFKTNSKFDYNTKKWTVKNSTRNLNKVASSNFFVEVEDFTNYKTKLNTQNFIRANFPKFNYSEDCLFEISEDICGFFNFGKAKAYLIKKDIELFLENLKK